MPLCRRQEHWSHAAWRCGWPPRTFAIGPSPGVLLQKAWWGGVEARAATSLVAIGAEEQGRNAHSQLLRRQLGGNNGGATVIAQGDHVCSHHDHAGPCRDDGRSAKIVEVSDPCGATGEGALF